MAHYRILYWKSFPAQVKAWDGDEQASIPLPKRFERALNVAAMVEGSISHDDYLEGWHSGPVQERTGNAQQVAEAVVAELETAYSFERLQKMVRSYRAAGDEA